MNHRIRVLYLYSYLYFYLYIYIYLSYILELSIIHPGKLTAGSPNNHLIEIHPHDLGDSKCGQKISRLRSAPYRTSCSGSLESPRSDISPVKPRFKSHELHRCGEMVVEQADLETPWYHILKPQDWQKQYRNHIRTSMISFRKTIPCSKT